MKSIRIPIENNKLRPIEKGCPKLRHWKQIIILISIEIKAYCKIKHIDTNYNNIPIIKLGSGKQNNGKLTTNWNMKSIER